MKPLIIFDCDGTLTDSEYLNNKANADVLRSYGFEKYTVEYSAEHFIGTTLNDIRKIIEAEQGRKVPDSYVPDYLALVREYQKTMLRAVDGAVDAAQALSRDYKTCVASNGERENVITSLQMIGLFDLFGEERTFTKVQVARGKPAPDLFLFAAERMEARPEDCIVIEDSVPGVLAARAAGMYAIGFTGTAHDRAAAHGKLEAAGAMEILPSWTEIQHSIKALITAKTGL